MVYRIAAVSFLNTIPLVESLATREQSDITLVKDLPSRLPSLLDSGAADVALVPIVELFRGHGGGFLDGIGIACDGPVSSVKLFLNGPPQDIRVVLADRGSRTSIALTQILLAESFTVRPEVREVTPQPGAWPAAGEATLVIGDRCFEYEAALAAATDQKIEVIDLGAWWKERTGLPFVFAVWSVSEQFLQRSAPEQLSALKEILTSARDDGLRNLDSLAAREAANGHLGHEGKATADAIAYYFRESLRFSLGTREMAGVKLFHELCVQHGMAPAGVMPPVL